MTQATSNDRAAGHPYRLFPVRVRRTRRVSPSFVRITFGGPELASFADNGYDQRIKLVLPMPGVGFGHLSDGPDWYQHWRELPDNLRNPLRTYTVRAARPESGEVDVDFALHGTTGPASRWAADAGPGDAVVIVGPDARYPGEHGGIDFRPHHDATGILLAGDETAAPAICGILEKLPGHSSGHALIEVPHAVDTQPVRHPPGMRVAWLGRDGAPHGSRLVPAVQTVAPRLLTATAAQRSGQRLDDVDIDTDLLWDVPDHRAAPAGGPYAWLAGEAGVIKRLRRHLVTDLGFNRRNVAFMGYWRHGRSEPCA